VKRVAAPEPQRQLVAFRLGNSELAVDVHAVQEVLRAAPAAPVPSAPDWVEGVIEHRGALLPVLDLRRRFQVTGQADRAEARVLVAEVAGERIGLVVDRVTEVLAAPESAFEPLPAGVAQLAPEGLRQVARLADRLILLLDLGSLLSTPERAALRELETALREAGYYPDASDPPPASSGAGDATATGHPDVPAE
jgi:purine-binding chemotaxis protein CheW